MNKYDFLVKKILKDKKYESVLDVGCRDCILKKYIINNIKEYKGLDLYQNKDKSVDYICNFEDEKIIEKNSFELVTALDLLEHLDYFQKGLDRLLDISKKDVLINLPNIGHIYFRIKFLLFGNIGNKYKLKFNMEHDRHRWVTTIKDMDLFFKEYTENKNYKLEKFYFYEGKKIKPLGKLLKFIGLSESLYV